VSEWRWECHPDDLLDSLPPEVRKQLDQLAHEITVRDSMVYLDGKSHSGETPGLPTEYRGGLMVTYLTDVRGERVVILQVAWFELLPNFSANIASSRRDAPRAKAASAVEFIAARG
jgi:hypothetical protein